MCHTQINHTHSCSSVQHCHRVSWDVPGQGQAQGQGYGQGYPYYPYPTPETQVRYVQYILYYNNKYVVEKYLYCDTLGSSVYKDQGIPISVTIFYVAKAWRDSLTTSMEGIATVINFVHVLLKISYCPVSYQKTDRATHTHPPRPPPTT